MVCPTPHALASLTSSSNNPAQKATCSCGKQSALHCDCNRQATENSTAGDRCSCGQRPAGECTCDSNANAASALETDFTTRK